MKLTHIVICANALMALSCSQKGGEPISNAKHLQEGTYRFALQIDSYELPFTAMIEYPDSHSNARLTIFNAEEKIEVQNVRITQDSLVAELPVFNSALLGRIESPELVTGSYINYNKKDRLVIPFAAEYGKDYRFTNTKSSTKLPERYKVSFHPGTDEEYPAVLLLQNKEGKLNATFLTETGDYRYLEGNIMNNSIYLSGFDGSHVFYFEARIDGQKLTDGVFYSGLSFSAPWQAFPDSTYELTHPEKLTYLLDANAQIELNFPNENGDTLGWNAMNLDNKVVILDIFGSWCPNCMDASIALHQISKAYDRNQVEIVPIAFEITEDFSVAKKRVFKMQTDLGLPQHFLFGGYASKKSASSAFPMLNHIMSFPTIVIIDKNRKVRSIYTGFYGPGTGAYYETFMNNTKALIDTLIQEG
jgi:thiol-disulfide isomerase/thioredoxin